MKLADVLSVAREELKYFRMRYLVLSDRRYLRKRFKQRLGRELNLANPTLYNDKLQWLKLHWHDPLAPSLVDKYSVREYVSEKIGEEFLNNLIAVYDRPEEIDFDRLPDSFVLKATHGSGWNIICCDKAVLDRQLARKKLRRWLRRNAYANGRSWVYKNIKPRIVCEEYLQDRKTGDLRDYKIFCFSGRPFLIQVDFSRFVNHRRNLYSPSWDLMTAQFQYPSSPNVELEKPPQLQDMLSLAAQLAEPFPHCRVDFYIVDERIIFGELTFFPESGFGRFHPQQMEVELGAALTLPGN